MVVCSFRPSSLAGLRDVGPRRVQSSFCTCSKTLRATLSSRSVYKSWIPYCIVSQILIKAVSIYFDDILSVMLIKIQSDGGVKKHWLLKVYQYLGGFVLLHLLVSSESSRCVCVCSGLQEILVLSSKDMKRNRLELCVVTCNSCLLI